MKYIAKRVQIKGIITLRNLLNVYSLSRLAIDNKKYAVKYYKCIMMELTTLKKVRFWHLRKLKTVLKELDLLKKENVELNPVDPEKRIKNICSWIGVRMNKSQNEVLQFGKNDIDEIINKLQEKEALDNLSLIKAHHLPKEFNKEISKILNGLKNKTLGTNSDKRVIMDGSAFFEAATAV